MRSRSLYKDNAKQGFKQLNAVNGSVSGLRFSLAVDGGYSGGVFAATTFAQ